MMGNFTNYLIIVTRSDHGPPSIEFTPKILFCSIILKNVETDNVYCSLDIKR